MHKLLTSVVVCRIFMQLPAFHPDYHCGWTEIPGCCSPCAAALLQQPVWQCIAVGVVSVGLAQRSHTFCHGIIETVS